MKIKEVLIFYIGAVLLFTAIHRLFFLSEEKKEEVRTLHLPLYSDQFILLFELVVGVLLLLPKFAYKIQVLVALTLFLVVACLLDIYYHYDELVRTYKDMFTVHANSTSLAMHVHLIFLHLVILYFSQ